MKFKWRKISADDYVLEGREIVRLPASENAYTRQDEWATKNNVYSRLRDAKRAIEYEIMRERGIQNNPRDYCYRKVKKQYKVFPSAYASGAIVQCRRRLGKNRLSLEKKYGLHGWFMRGGGKGWVDCKTGKPCGRKKGEKRKYPACRPTMKMCNSAMRKKRGRKRISWVRKNGRMSDREKADIIARWAYKVAENFVKKNMSPYIPGTWPVGIDEANEYMDVVFHVSDKLKRMAKGSYWSFKRNELLAKYPIIHKNPVSKSIATVSETPKGKLLS